MKFHHYGYLTKNLNKTILVFKRKSYIKISNIIECKFQNVKLIFFKKKDSKYFIELVDCAKNNQLKKFFKKKVKKQKNKLYFKYHKCYYVKNLDSTCKKFQKNLNFKSLETRSESAVFKKIVFFKKKNSDILLEFVSRIKKRHRYLI